MSDEIKITPEETTAYIEREAAREKKRKEVLEKELTVKDHRLTQELDRLSELKKEKENTKNTNYGILSDEAVEKLEQENTDYMQAAKNKMRFVHEQFDDAIPFYRKNLILVGGVSGDGKSTTVANIIWAVLRQPHSDGKRRRILVLTNEEKTEDVYNRIICLSKGWAYVHHDKFTKEQIEFFNKSYKFLRQVVTVVDNTYGNGFGVTSTLEGVCGVFDNLIANKEYYDVVLIDYYQNIDTSTEDPRLTEYQVHAKLAKRLDKYKNVYPAPIVLMAQVRPVDDSNTPFKIRIEGAKMIYNVCTCTIELIADKTLRKTDWKIHKSRFNDALGATIMTGFDRGRHVIYDDAFRDAIARMLAAREVRAFDQQISLPVVTAEDGKGDKNE
jgi:hypothetical protein